MKQRILNVLFVYFVVTSSLIANSNSEEPQGQKQQYTIRQGCEKPLEISIGWWGIDALLVENDALREKIEGEFNITIKGRNTTWSDWQEKYRLWAVSGELPDIFANDIVNTTDYFKWIEQGIIEPLPEDLSNYPNIQKIMNIEEVKALRQPDGKQYIIPRIKQYEDDKTTMARGLFVRKDWMKKMGFSNPKSFEEFLNMTSAFTFKDPDGNGADDTVGITVHNKWYLPTLFLPTSPNTLNDSWVKKDGKWIPSWTTDGFYKGLEQLHTLYQEGILDPDLSILKGYEGREKFAAGKAGIYIAQTTPGYVKDLRTSWETYTDKPFEEAVAILHVWPSEDGIQYRHTEKSFWSSTYFRGGLEKDKMERVLKLYDYLLSDEGVQLVTYGIENEDYIISNGDITLTWEEDADGNLIDLMNKYKSLGIFAGIPAWYEFTWYKDTPINRLTFTEEGLKMSLESYKWKMENAVAIPTNYKIDLMVTPAKSKIALEVDQLIKVILDENDPVNGWNDVLKEYEEKGLSQAIIEVNQKAVETGY